MEISKTLKSGNEVLISIIVPVYNVERYLERCVNSLVNQTYKNLEIILVDDGATDSSGVLCDFLAKQDERIQVIHKTNGGLSDARNVGMRVAKGELIAFVDSDDYIHHEMYERMHSAMKREGSDIIICGICSFEDGHDVQNGELDNTYENVDSPDIYKCLVDKDIVTVVQWNKLFKKEVLEGIEYPIGKLHEDVYVIHRELARCKRITYLDAKMYFYMQRSDSIMHTESEKSIEDGIEGLESRIDFFDKRGLNNERNDTINEILSSLYWKIKDSAGVDGFSEKNRWLAERYSLLYEKYKIVNADIVYNIDLLTNPKGFCQKEKMKSFVAKAVVKIKKCKRLLRPFAH